MSEKNKVNKVNKVKKDEKNLNTIIVGPKGIKVMPASMSMTGGLQEAFDEVIRENEEINERNKNATKPPYDGDDIEMYLEYVKQIWEKVQTTFYKPNVSRDNVTDDLYNAVSGAMMQGIYVDLMAKMVEPFYQWLTHDCAVTGHKCREMR